MRLGTWSYTLRNAHRLRVCQNKVLRNLSELIGNEVTVVRKNVHNKDLALYCSSNIIVVTKSMRMR